MKSILVAILTGMTLLPAWAEESVQVRSKLQASLSESIHEEFRDSLVALFEDKGLAGTDAERMVKQFSSDMAGCVLDALEESLQRRSLTIANISADSSAE